MELNFRIYDLLARDHRTIQAEELEKLRKDSRYTGKTDKELESKAGRAATRELEERINAAGGELMASLHPGDRLLLHSGPFAGYQGIFDACLSGTDRVRILLNLLQNRQVRLEVPLAQVRLLAQR